MGKEKCCCGNCSGCCIRRIEIDYGIPVSGGEPFVTLAWNVETQPTTIVTIEYLEGIYQEVCTQTFYAPVIELCSGTSINFLINILTREFDVTGREKQSFGLTCSIYYHNGGQIWKHNFVIQNLRVVISRTSTKTRTQILCNYFDEYITYPAPGKTIDIKRCFGDCDIIDLSIGPLTQEFDTGLCQTFPNSACPSTLGRNIYFGQSEGSSILINSLQYNSNWIIKSCTELEEGLSWNDVLYEYNGNYGGPNGCRIPTGLLITPIIISGLCPYDIYEYTYSTEISYNTTNKIRLLNCNDDPCSLSPCGWVWLDETSEWIQDTFNCGIHSTDPTCGCIDPPSTVGTFNGETRLSGYCRTIP